MNKSTQHTPRQRRPSAWQKSLSHWQRGTTNPHEDQHRVSYTYVESIISWGHYAKRFSQTPHTLLPKLLGELRSRYLDREGGYTRVVRTESKNTYDQGESAILEFVDGPKDSRFMMTAKTVARDRMLGMKHTPVTRTNMKKVTQFRGEEPFEEMVRRFMVLKANDETVPQRDESSLAEVESAKMADKNAERAKEMAAGIVPESVKKTSQ